MENSGKADNRNNLPEPTPWEMPEYYKQKYKDFFNDFPIYPRDALIVSSGFAFDQSIHLREEDLKEDVHLAKKLYQDRSQPFTTFASALADLLADRYPGNVAKWREDYINKGIDAQTNLSTIRKEGASSCFHRGVIYSYILQQLGIESKVLEGDWVETNRKHVLGNYPGHKEVPKYVKPGYYSGANYYEGEEGEGHDFVLARKNDQYYLIDPALKIKGESSKHHVVKPVTQEELMSRDILVSLPDGRYRHYVFKTNTVSIEKPI